MKTFLAIVFAALLFPTLSSACGCISPGNPKPPTSRDTRQWIEHLSQQNVNILRVKVLNLGDAGDSTVRFLVIDSWKGSYKAGDTFIAKSREVTSCDTSFKIGDESLVSFNELSEANFVAFACPDHFPQQRRKLEDKHLQRMSRRPTETNSKL
jgi:hypothetical protein